jgi:hypothetical protein
MTEYGIWNKATRRWLKYANFKHAYIIFTDMGEAENHARWLSVNTNAGGMFDAREWTHPAAPITTPKLVTTDEVVETISKV